MKKFLIVSGILVLLLASGVIYLVATTPKQGSGIRFPLDARSRALLASVPSDADAFAILPQASVLDAKLRANPVTAAALDRFSASHTLPRPWMAGGADLVVWRSGKQTTYLLRLDPLRGVIARAWLTMAGDERASRLLLDVANDRPLAGEEMERIAALAHDLPPGDALVVNRARRRGAFPPIERPAVSSIRITPSTIDIVSRSAASDLPVTGRPLMPQFAADAILSGSFASPPRILDDMSRLTGARASSLLGDGGSVTLYKVDSGKLLPRPHEVIAVPATPEHRMLLQKLTSDTFPRNVTELAGFHVATAEARGQLLVAFDDDSIPRYLADTFETAQLPANVWSLRIDPQRALPLVDELNGNPALRFLAPRVQRSARELGDWIEPLRSARAIEAGLSAGAGIEELRVRIAAK